MFTQVGSTKYYGFFFSYKNGGEGCGFDSDINGSNLKADISRAGEVDVFKRISFAGVKDSRCVYDVTINERGMCGEAIYRWTDVDSTGAKLASSHVEFTQEGEPMCGLEAIRTISKMYADEGRLSDVLTCISEAIRNND